MFGFNKPPQKKEDSVADRLKEMEETNKDIPMQEAGELDQATLEAKAAADSARYDLPETERMGYKESHELGLQDQKEFDNLHEKYGSLNLSPEEVRNLEDKDESFKRYRSMKTMGAGSYNNIEKAA